MRIKAGLTAAVVGFAVLSSNASAGSPSAVGASSPSNVAPGHATLLTVSVTPGADPASSGVFVSCNLSSIGGDFTQMLVDDGTSGDAHAGDLVFSYRATVSPATALGPRSLPCVISDAQGRSTFAEIALNVDALPNQPPSASGGGPYRADEGSAVNLAAAGADPENRPLAFAWDLDGDGSFESPGQSVSFTPDDGPSTRAISVQVTDGDGLTAVAPATVTVANVAPTASFHASVSSSGRLQLALEAPRDPSHADATAGFTYSFDCGDGYGPFTSAAIASCAAGPGVASVRGRIRDKDGGVGEYGEAVRIQATFDNLCALTRSLSRKPRVADALCRRLAKADAAKTRKQRRRYLRAYRHEVHAQTGRQRTRAFSPADGARLEAFALVLERR